jgi:poly(A) polymerase
MLEHREARLIVDTLSKAGFIAYYAGGWVRDLLLQHESDDIDIATNAPPETIQALFAHTVPLGIAFGIVLVIIDHHQYEVATFRQDIDYKDGRRPSRIEFATAIEDAKRRDFTINGMFYDPLQNQILDYVGGEEDLKKKLIRAIGNPHERIQEDRLRMIRAIRLACRFNFTIDPETEDAIRFHAKELFPAVAIERITQELQKGHDFHKLPEMLLQLHSFGLLQAIFPALEEIPLSEIENRLKPTKTYPTNAPVIAFLLPLFPHDNLDQQLELCKKLKLSTDDQKFITFLNQIKHLRQADKWSWAHVYANPLSELCLNILFGNNHEHHRNELQEAIQRIQEKNPVVKSIDLLKAGIQPGKRMGELLREAEKIAINENIQDTQKILKRLDIYQN